MIRSISTPLTPQRCNWPGCHSPFPPLPDEGPVAAVLDRLMSDKRQQRVKMATVSTLAAGAAGAAGVLLAAASSSVAVVAATGLIGAIAGGVTGLFGAKRFLEYNRTPIDGYCRLRTSVVLSAAVATCAGIVAATCQQHGMAWGLFSIGSMSLVSGMVGSGLAEIEQRSGGAKIRDRGPHAYTHYHKTLLDDHSRAR